MFNECPLINFDQCCGGQYVCTDDYGNVVCSGQTLAQIRERDERELAKFTQQENVKVANA